MTLFVFLKKQPGARFSSLYPLSARGIDTTARGSIDPTALAAWATVGFAITAFLEDGSPNPELTNVPDHIPYELCIHWIRPYGGSGGVSAADTTVQCAASACMERGEPDDDCCGRPAQTSCAPGFTQSVADNGCTEAAGHGSALLVGVCCSADTGAEHPTTGPAAHYELASNADDTEGDAHGTVSGAVLSPDRFGVPDAAYSFDGRSNFITVPTPFHESGTQDFTIAIWLKPTEINTPRIWHGFVGYQEGSGSSLTRSPSMYNPSRWALPSNHCPSNHCPSSPSSHCHRGMGRRILCCSSSHCPSSHRHHHENRLSEYQYNVKVRQPEPGRAALGLAGDRRRRGDHPLHRRDR